MKRLTLLLSLFTLSVFGQEVETPSKLEKPKDWGIENIPFPINFAKQIEYKGLEEIRFAPGWAKATSDDYWSYVFLWSLEGKNKIDAKTLESHLKNYFEGLAAATPSVPREKLIPVVATNTLEKKKKDNDIYFEGTVYILNYMSHQPKTLNYKIYSKLCESEDKTYVFFELSPQPYKHVIWKSLDKLQPEIKCKK